MLQDNLKIIRITLGYSQQEIADKLNISINTYRGYEYNKREMPYEILKFLINTFNVNINWLLTGQGNMFINTKINNNQQIEENIGNKLIEIQKQNNYKNKDMSKLLGIYEYEYEELTQGKRKPTLEILHNIKQNFNISIDLLLYGE